MPLPRASSQSKKSMKKFFRRTSSNLVPDKGSLPIHLQHETEPFKTFHLTNQTTVGEVCQLICTELGLQDYVQFFALKVKEKEKEIIAHIYETLNIY